MEIDPEPDDMPTTVDVLRYGEPDDNPRYMTVPGDHGTKVVGAHSRDEVARKRRRLVVVAVLAIAVASVTAYFRDGTVGVATASVVLIVSSVYEYLRSERVPEVVGRNIHAADALEQYDVEGYVDEVFVREDDG